MNDITILTREDVLLLGGDDMDHAHNVIEKGFELYNNGKILQPAKTSLKFLNLEKNTGVINTLPAGVDLGSKKIFGVKIIGAMPNNVKKGIPRATGVIVLFNDATKSPFCIMDAQVISAMRTGAVSSVACELICDPDTKKIGLVGAGVNMRTQFLGVMRNLKKVEKVYVYSRGNTKYDFIEKMSKKFNRIKFIATQKVIDAVAESELVITCAANISKPIVKKKYYKKEGLTIFNIGCHESEESILKSMDLIISDNWEQSKHRGVQTHSIAFSKGIIKDSDVSDIFDLYKKYKSGKEIRKTKDSRIFFGPTGLGFEDVLLAYSIYEKSKKNNAFRKIKLWENQNWI
jgi:N-[(2S)-2-amino-2-carboxyethyl]-L-glutamate dehydrogenase